MHGANQSRFVHLRIVGAMRLRVPESWSIDVGARTGSRRTMQVCLTRRTY